jgi:hypothetical protein
MAWSNRNYDTPHCQMVIKSIAKFVRQRGEKGATAMMIADHIRLSRCTVNDYLSYMRSNDMLHSAVPHEPGNRNKGSGVAGIYKIGKKPMGKAALPNVSIKPARVYADLPLAFFKGATA